MTPEGRVKKAVKDILLRHDVLPGPEGGSHGWYFMPVAGRFGKRGIPDFICNVAGYFVAIETKANGEEPTDLQELNLNGITKASGISLVVDETNLELVGTVLTNVIGGNRDGVLHLSWRRVTIRTPKNNSKKSRPKTKASSMERDRNWQDFQRGMGD
jgi:hypothetical protein